MKMPWDKLFRRKSVTETELKEDYPTDLESDISEDDRGRGQWTRQPGTPSVRGRQGRDEPEEWEYFSEYNVSFSSDNSIIDAYREHGGRVAHDDREFEDVFKQAIQVEIGHNDRGRKDTKKQYLCPPTMDVKQGSASPRSTRSREQPPKVRDKIQAFEQSSAGKRRASCFPVASEKMSDQHSVYRYGTWNTGNARKRQRKPPKQRRRAGDHRPEYSEDESKYTVNLSLDELNDIIKKNVSSAMKTITSVNGRGRKIGAMPISPSESFSTETETMFSGSSSHSTELPPGVLNKQIKAQLDKDFLRGHRRLSLAPGLVSEMEGGRSPNPVSFNPNQVQTMHAVQDNHQFGNAQQHQQQPFGNVQQQQLQQQQQPYGNVQQQQPYGSAQMQQPYLMQPGANPVVPPAPPLPPSIPQVTFNVPGGGYPGYDQIQPRSPLETFDQDLMSSLGSGIPPAALGRLQARRHTLASLGNENLLSGLNDNFESKLEQVSKAIRMLDNNINLEDSAGSSTAGQGVVDNNQTKTESSPEPSASAQNTPSTTNTGKIQLCSSPQQDVDPYS